MLLVEEINTRNQQQSHTGANNDPSSASRKRVAASGNSSSRLRAINRRLTDLNRENYHDNVKIEVPKPRLIREVKQGLTTNSRRVLGSRKTLNNHQDDDPANTQKFLNAAASRSRYPARPICSICGYWGKMTCIRCGERYCSGACGTTHQETRCMKSYG